MRKRDRMLMNLVVVLLVLQGVGFGFDETVTKYFVEIPSFGFESGETIPVLRLGVEAYGTLSPTRDNAILLCHFFAGDSHAAGHYASDPDASGWWDELIGPGLPLDTDRFCIICTDLPCGMNVKSPTVVTTGPATVNPQTGELWGTDFPETTVRDMVRAQRAVLDVLGVTHLRLVTGPSLGGMLAWQWAVEYPDFVDLVMPVGGPTDFSSTERSGLSASSWAIRSDPCYLFGDYASYGVEPVVGLAMALEGLNAIMKGEQLSFFFHFYKHLSRARELDANHYLYTLELHRSWDLGQEYGSRAAAFQRVRCRVVVVAFDDDDFIPPERMEDAVDELQQAGVQATLEALQGSHGHLSVLEDLGELAPVFTRELATP